MDLHCAHCCSPSEAARHLAVNRHSAVIRKQLDRVVEAAHRIFADAFEIELVLDEVAERAAARSIERLCIKITP